MKKLNLLFTLLMLSVTAIVFTSCSEDEPADAGTAVAGRYAGQLISGGSIVEQRCFVTLERYSANDVKLTLESDNHNINSAIFKVNNNGSEYSLTSDTYDAYGTIKGATLNFYYSTSSSYSYSFTGEKQ